MKKPVEFSFEAENEEKRKRDGRNNNVLKSYGIKQTDDVFYVGSPDLIDPYSGKHVYIPSSQQLETIEAKEREAREQIEEFNNPEVPMMDAVPGSDAVDDASSDMSSEDLDLANEIYARLMAEAAADEAAKAAEIEAIKLQQEQENPSESDYNAETGSYSGLYGKKPMSESESDILASIMSTNNSYTKSIDDLIAENQE